MSGISAWLLIGVEHEARRELIGLFNSVAARGSILQAGDFRGIGQRVIYVAERHRDNRLERVMISDRSQNPPFLIFAERGHLDLDEASALIHLQLEEGEMHIAADGLDTGSYRRVLFHEFDYSFDVTTMLSGDARPVRPKQMSLDELRGVIARGKAGDPLHELVNQKPVLNELEMQRRFALPLAPLLFAIAAVPLALLGQRSSRAWGPIASLALAFVFYSVFTLMQFLAAEGWLPPVVALWIPNLLLLGLSLQLLRRAELGVSR